MSIRKLDAREYLVNLAAAIALMPVYGRREHAARPALDAFAFRRARDMAVHAGVHVPVYRERYEAAGVDPRAITNWEDFRRLPLMDKTNRRTARHGITSANRPTMTSGMMGQAIASAKGHTKTATKPARPSASA